MMERTSFVEIRNNSVYLRVRILSFVISVAMDHVVDSTQHEDSSDSVRSPYDLALAVEVQDRPDIIVMSSCLVYARSQFISANSSKQQLKIVLVCVYFFRPKTVYTGMVSSTSNVCCFIIH